MVVHCRISGPSVLKRANSLPVYQISRSEKQNCYDEGVCRRYVAGRVGLARLARQLLSSSVSSSSTQRTTAKNRTETRR
jgi:hypothetical protein